MNNVHSRVTSRSGVGQSSRFISRCIVNDDDLVIGNFTGLNQRTASLMGGTQRARDVLLFVPHRKKERQFLEMSGARRHRRKLSVASSEFGL